MSNDGFEWCRECYCYHDPAAHVDLAVIARLRA